MNSENELFYKVQDILKNCIYRNDCKILFDPNNSMEYQLDEVGEKFFEIIMNEDSLNDVVLKICDFYNISDLKMIKKDLLEFLNNFIKKEINKVNNIAN